MKDQINRERIKSQRPKGWGTCHTPDHLNQCHHPKWHVKNIISFNTCTRISYMYMSNYWYGIVFKQSAPKSHGPSFLYIGRVRGLPYFQIYHIPTYISHIYSIQTLYGVPCCALLPILSISPHPPRSTKGVLSCHPLVHPWKGISNTRTVHRLMQGDFPAVPGRSCRQRRKLESSTVTGIFIWLASLKIHSSTP